MKYIGIDPQAAWRKERDKHKPLSDEQWAELFAAGDRDSLILACIPLIDRENRTTHKSIRDDVAQFALIRATRVVDRLLAKPHPVPAAYLCTAIRGAISQAKVGATVESRDCVSTPVRRTKPQPRPTNSERDRLVAKWENDGRSPQWIEAELDSLGLQSGATLKRVQDEWPEDETGKPLEFAAPIAAADFDFLSELVEIDVLTQEQFDWLKLKAQGWLNVEIFKRFGVSSSEQTQIRKDIQSAIQSYAQRHGFDRGDL
jgi:hypothetical protein